MRQIGSLVIGFAVLCCFTLAGLVPVLAQSQQLNLTFCPNTPPKLRAWFEQSKSMFGKTDGNPLAAAKVCYDQARDQILLTLIYNTARSKIKRDDGGDLSNGFFAFKPDYRMLFLVPTSVLNHDFFRRYWDFAAKNSETTVYPRATIFLVDLVNSKGDALRLPMYIPANSGNVRSTGEVCILQRTREEPECFTGKDGSFPTLTKSTDKAGNPNQQGLVYNMALSFFSIEKAVAKPENQCKPDSMHTCD